MCIDLALDKGTHDPLVSTVKECLVLWATVVWDKVVPIAQMQLALGHWTRV